MFTIIENDGMIWFHRYISFSTKVLLLHFLYCSSDGIDIVDADSDVIYSVDPCDQLPKTSLWDRLGRVSMMDIESSSFSWSSLSSLHHTKHTTTSTEPAEDDTGRSFEVSICFTYQYISVNYLFVDQILAITTSSSSSLDLFS